MEPPGAVRTLVMLNFPHLPGIVGLIMITIGSIMCFWFPLDAKGHLKKGTWKTVGGFTQIGTDESDRLYRYYKSGFYIALVLIVAGSFLGLIDLLIKTNA
jgi:hypothetical protein